MNRIWLYMIAFMLSAGCERSIDWDLDTRPTELLVVEAMVTNEDLRHEVRLTRTTEEIHKPPGPVSGAVVVIHDGQNGIRLWEDTDSAGYYRPHDSFRAVYSKVYALYIIIGDERYVASARMVPVQPLREIAVVRHPEYKNWFRLQLQDSEDPSMIEYDLDWSHLAPAEAEAADTSHARLVHYTLQSVDVNQMFKPDKKAVYFPLGTIVTRRKHSLSPEHQSFIRTLLSETEWRGGWFDVQTGNVQTNLSNGAVGYFSVTTVVSDKTIILGQK